MNLSKPLALIGIYSASEILITASFRIFQIFCTWYFVKELKLEELWGNVLLAIWIVGSAMLPMSGTIIDRFKKTNLLLLTTIVSAVFVAASLFAFHTYEGSSDLFYIFLAISIILSVGNSIVTPMGGSLIPDIAKTEKELVFGMRVKHSTFLINLLIGPVLGGILVDEYGGFAVLAFSVGVAVVSIAFAVALKAFHTGPKPAGNRAAKNIAKETIAGLKRSFSIREERIIAIASLILNFYLVPFIYLILPLKMIRNDYSMTSISIVEIAMGCAMLFTSFVLLPQAVKHFSNHKIASISLVSMVIGFVGFSWTDSMYGMCFLSYLIGMGLSGFNVTVNTKRSQSIPDGFRGAMESSILFLCTLSVPLGIFTVKSLIPIFAVDTIILMSGLLFFPPLYIIFSSSSLKAMLDHDHDGEPFYKSRYRNAFSS